MATTFNPEIEELIKNEGGSVVYSSGNIIVASEISRELYIELSKSPYIDSLESLPLKRFGGRVREDIPTVSIDNESVAFDDLNYTPPDDENQSGSGNVG